MSEELKSGTETSEYKMARALLVAAGVLEGVSVLLAKLHEAFPSAQWLSVAMSVVGAVLAVVTFREYNKGRVITKTITPVVVEPPSNVITTPNPTPPNP